MQPNILHLCVHFPLFIFQEGENLSISFIPSKPGMRLGKTLSKLKNIQTNKMLCNRKEKKG